MAWIEEIASAWKGHRQFAEWLVANTKNDIIVELGVDYGYSTFVFGTELQKYKNSIIYGIDLFIGDEHAGKRNTYETVLNNITNHNLTNIQIIVSDFTKASETWSKPINILHIDGFHTYEAVKNDFNNWSKFVQEDGIILFHDTHVEHFGIKDFFRELTGGYKLYFNHSYGLGIYTKNKKLYENILNSFTNVYDFNTNPF